MCFEYTHQTFSVLSCFTGKKFLRIKQDETNKAENNGGEVTKSKEKEMNNMSISWLRGSDSNGRPPGYEPGELPTAPPRDVISDLRLQS